MKPENDRPDFSIVIPVFNEEETMPELIERTLKAARSLNKRFELILIDDGSSDDSPLLMTSAAEENAEIVSVFLNRNYGQHAAVMAGLEASLGRIVITLDADLQNPPEEIPHLFNRMEEGFDVVGTVRMNRQDSMFRKLASYIINRAVQKTTGVAMRDYGCMLRAYSRSVVDAMLLCHERSTFIPVLANSFARRTSEIDVSHAERAVGDSKYSVWKLISLQFDLLTCMTTLPLRLLSIFGAAVAAVGMGFGLLLMILRFVHGPAWAGDGVFTLFAILFFFIGAQFMSMGMLGEYIGRIYHDVRGRPRYFVERITGREPTDAKLELSLAGE